MDIGADTGIYLVLGKKIAGGGRYYYDFFESNFPINFYFYALQYQLSEAIHISPIILSEIIINLLALSSIFWSAKILRDSTIYENKAHYNLIIIGYFLGFFLRPEAIKIAEFGTKTSLLLIALYPYIAYSFERKNEFTKKDLTCRGLLMGLMPCIKPHYLVLIIFIELHRFWQKKSLKFFWEIHPFSFKKLNWCILNFLRETSRAPHSRGTPIPNLINADKNSSASSIRFGLDKLVMCLVGALYLFLTVKFTPEFFEFMVPMWSSIYYGGVKVFLENSYRHLAARVTIFSFIFLIFSRLKLSANDKVLALFFLSASLLLILENILTIDQVAIFYAVTTICFLKFLFDAFTSKQILFSENKFIITTLIFIPAFDLEMLPTSIFGLGGFIESWKPLALIYPIFLFKKLDQNQRRKYFSAKNISLFLGTYFAVICAIILTFKNAGAWVYIAVNLSTLFIILFLFEKKINSKFSTFLSSLSVFVIIASTSCLLYSYLSGIVAVLTPENQITPPNKLSKLVTYYSQIYAPEKDDGIMMISYLNNDFYPAVNYLDKKIYQKSYIFSIEADEGVSGSSAIFQASNNDKIFTLSYLLDDIKNQLKNPQVKLLFINNTPQTSGAKKRCLLGALEYYFLDPEFKKLFLKNFHFENYAILTQKVRSVEKVNFFSGSKMDVFDQVKSSNVKVFYDFEIYVRNEK